MHHSNRPLTQKGSQRWFDEILNIKSKRIVQKLLPEYDPVGKASRNIKTSYQNTRESSQLSSFTWSENLILKDWMDILKKINNRSM